MKPKDYNLVTDSGVYNKRAIMQLAFAHYRRNKSILWYSFGNALKEAWVDASLKMDEYKAMVSPVYTDYPKPANNLRQVLIDLNPLLKSYDSSWR